MASTFSTNLALELIGTGDQAGTWGITTNTNLGTLIEQAISGYVTQAVATGTDTTITIPDGATGVARNMYIELTGTGGASTNLIVPANKKLYFIFNNSTGAVTVKVSGQTGVSVPQGKKMVLVNNGTDIVTATNYVADFGSNSATITQLTSTSATITNLTLTSLVLSNLSIASANVTTLTSASATITNLLATSLTVSGNTFLATSSGNVGIGTSSPTAAKLHVAGYNGGSVYPIRMTSTNSGVEWAFETGGANAAGSYLAFRDIGNSAERMRLDSSGNLGLGVTPAATVGTTEFALGSASTNPRISGIRDGSNAFLVYSDSTGTDFYERRNLYLRFGTNNTERARITAGGSFLMAKDNAIGINTSDGSDNGYLALCGASADGSSRGGHIYLSGNERTGNTGTVAIAAGNVAGGIIEFRTGADVERARIDSAGNFMVGVTSALGKVSILQGATSNTDTLILKSPNASGAGSQPGIQFLRDTNAVLAKFYADTNSGALITEVNGSERARITSGGILGVGVTNPTGSTADAEGIQITPTYILANRSGNAGLGVNRKTNDGDLVVFYQADDLEGSISVSGNTVSYNAFAGSHWSQLQDGSKPDILRGTVMESINELCEWPGEQNERLPKSKISDTAGSKKVYGVFMAWDNDWTETNDMYVTAVGAFICRVNGSVTVQEGDLLESNGDGTARVQADDIIRSSTIGKVTSTVKTHQYDDGSYCVPTVLYCG